MTVLAILGGGTPFVTDLVDGLPPLGAWQLRLYGRDAGALLAVGARARHALDALGHSVLITDDLGAALDGAEIVIHQVRYGGLAGSAFDERLAARIGVAAEETLGPAALNAALRMAPPLLETAEAIRHWCPGAWVLNLTNPLSCSTAILDGVGLRRVLGLCELPDATMRQACRILDRDPATVEWDYVGLNHRGFVHALSADGADLLSDLPDRMGDRTIGGITAAQIADLGAIPVKPMRLFLAPGASRPTARISTLSALRERVLSELRHDPARRPPSLRDRAMPWYADAVLPLLRSLRDGGPRVHVVNICGPDGLARERRARLHNGRVLPLATAPPPPKVAAWLDRFEAHERACLQAALDPSRERVVAALAADPMLSEQQARLAADAILAASTIAYGDSHAGNWRASDHV